MIGFPLRRIGAVAVALPVTAPLSPAAMPAQAGDEFGSWRDVRQIRH